MASGASTYPRKERVSKVNTKDFDVSTQRISMYQHKGFQCINTKDFGVSTQRIDTVSRSDLISRSDLMLKQCMRPRLGGQASPHVGGAGTKTQAVSRIQDGGSIVDQ